MIVDEWFPTLIYSDFINTNGLEEVAYNLKTKSDGVVKSNKNGWQSDVLKNEMFSKLIDDSQTSKWRRYNSQGPFLNK